MSNKNLNIQQLATVASASTPDAGYKKLFPKSGESNWYSMDDDGTEKQLSLAIYHKNGLLTTPLGSGQPYGSQIDIVLGGGLTFSADAAGSAILVSGLTAGSLNSTGGATSGYILTAGSGGQFNWTPFSFPGISGSTNSISKFTSPTTVGNSQINDNGTNVFIGTLPSFVPSLFNVNGSASIFGNIYLSDDYQSYLKWNNGFFFDSYQSNFTVEAKDLNYLRASYDGMNTYSFSVFNDSFYIDLNGATSGSARFRGYNLEVVEFGKVGQETTMDIVGRLEVNNPNGVGIVIIATATDGFRLDDGSSDVDKILTSVNGIGNSTWKYLGSGVGITVSGLTISVNSGLGLTFSSNQVRSDIGNGLTFSGNSMVVNRGNGLTFSGGQLALSIGSGLTFSSGSLDSKIFYISSTSSNGYTGTSSETILRQLVVAPNTVKSNDVVEVEFRIFKGGTSSSWTPSLRIGTSSTILGTGIITPTSLLSSTDYQTITVHRNLYVISSTNSTEFYPNLTSLVDIYTDSNKESNTAPAYSSIDWTQTQYIQLCSTMGTNSTADFITASYLRMKVWKQ